MSDHRMANTSAQPPQDTRQFQTGALRLQGTGRGSEGGGELGLICQPNAIQPQLCNEWLLSSAGTARTARLE